MHADVDARTIRTIAERLYDDEPGARGWLARHRPVVCPFELLVAEVPCGATVLDVGCGAGLFLGLLAATGRLARGVGIDPDGSAVARAQHMAARIADRTPDHAAGAPRLEFARHAPDAPLPSGAFDVVSMIDVLHHVAPDAQERAVTAALACVAPGGRFVYKDMARRPVLLALANRVHDALLARQWIHYVPIERVAGLARAAGFRVSAVRSTRRYVYAHELLVAERAAA